MATTALPMSTISYNSREFLEQRLNEMVKAGRLDNYRFIRHFGEDGDKDHIHLIVYPAKKIDFTLVSKDLQEVDLSHPNKPLGVQPWRKEQGARAPDHWLMYALHDEKYLKNHSRDYEEGKEKIRYKLSEVVTPYPEQLERDYKRAESLRDTDAQRVIDALKSGMSATEIMYSMDINPLKITTIARAYHEEQYAAKRGLYDDVDKNAPIQTDIGALFSADNPPDDEEPPFVYEQEELYIPDATRQAWGSNPYKGE